MKARLLGTKLVVTGVVMLAVQTTARAHAFLDHADPRVGSSVSRAPAQLRLWFTQATEPAFSTIEVFDAAGKEMDKKDTHVDPADRKVLVVSLPKLPPGTYKVSWRVLSVDTHRTRGDFKFTVK